MAGTTAWKKCKICDKLRVEKVQLKVVSVQQYSKECKQQHRPCSQLFRQRGSSAASSQGEPGQEG